MHKQALLYGTLFAALSVTLGAFGAHALKQMVDPDKLAVYETGVRYQFYHSFALIITGVLGKYYPTRFLNAATFAFVIGILLFSGSLYAMTFAAIGGGGLGPLGILTPIGGLFFIFGWIMLTLTVAKSK